jgi:23S rRNA pseudouridine2605 synthase
MANLTVLKTLALAGCGSRRAMAEAIKGGRVALNGTPVVSFTQEMNAGLDSLTLDGKLINPVQREHTYLMLNKPVGVLSTTRDERGRRTVIGLLPRRLRGLGLHPVGRLDMDSSGLLILTNDGELTQRLTHPGFEKEKEYLVTLDRPLDGRDKLSFESGLELQDGMTHEAEVKKSPGKQNAYYVILHEGRKRQLRRMFVVLGYHVTTLKRVRMGGLYLGNLPEGKTKPLTSEEISLLRGKGS